MDLKEVDKAMERISNKLNGFFNATKDFFKRKTIEKAIVATVLYTLVGTSAMAATPNIDNITVSAKNHASSIKKKAIDNNDNLAFLINNAPKDVIKAITIKATNKNLEITIEDKYGEKFITTIIPKPGKPITTEDIVKKLNTIVSEVIDNVNQLDAHIPENEIAMK